MNLNYEHTNYATILWKILIFCKNIFLILIQTDSKFTLLLPDSNGNLILLYKYGFITAK